MAIIDDTVTINGFAWIDDDTDELVWAYQEELQDVHPSERPNGCTPVVIEINPAEEWLNKKQQERDYISSLSEQISQFRNELDQVSKDIKLGE